MAPDTAGRSVSRALVLSMVGVAIACMAGAVTAEPSQAAPYSGGYVGHDANGGNFGLRVGANGITLVRWSGTWTCTHWGGPAVEEPSDFSKRFKRRPIPIKRRGKVAARRSFGGFQISLQGDFTSQKRFRGWLELSLFDGPTGCTSFPLQVGAKRT